jgi:hypothetical protein
MKYLILLLIPFLIAAAPSRDNSYTTGALIKSADVTANEDAIFNYLQAGVDTYSPLSIDNADISASANIQSGKLNLLSVTQDVLLNNDGNDPPLEINNDGTGHGLYLHGDGIRTVSKFTLYVDATAANTTGLTGFLATTNASSTSDNVWVSNTGTGTNLTVVQNTELASGNHSLLVNSAAAHVNSDSALAKIVQDNAGSSEPALEIQNDGSGEAILVPNVLTVASTGVVVSVGNLAPAKFTADPCGTLIEGAIFYNDTSNYHCFCNNAGADIKMNDNSTACF